MKANDIYDVSAELEQEFGAKGTPQREAAINHAWEEYNAQILLDARKNAGLTQAHRSGQRLYFQSRTRFDNPHCCNTLQDSGSNGNDCGTSPDIMFCRAIKTIQFVDLQLYYFMFNPTSTYSKCVSNSVSRTGI